MKNVSPVPDEHAHYMELYHTHYTRVQRLCRLFLEDSHEAEDVAQEVFLKLLQAQKGEVRPMVWGAWLTRVTLNACRDRRRSGWRKWWQGTHTTAPEDAWQVIDFPSPVPTPEEEVLRKETRWRIWRAYRELPTRQQEVFVLRYLEEWPTQAIAEALGLSIGSVKRHLFRAIRRLRTTLGGGL
jgi:RNA polymerase sigma-70 factor (ECF subfamily)